MGKAVEKLKEELSAMVAPTLYFFVTLHIVAWIRVLIARGAGVTLTTTVSVGVAALILGKAVLIADMLPWINRYPGHPLIYNVTWKTAIYLVVAAIVHYLEHLFEFARRAGGVVAGNRMLLDEIVWPHFWAIQLLLLLLIVMYCTVSEIVRAIGVDEFKRMFFGTGAAGHGRAAQEGRS